MWCSHLPQSSVSPCLQPHFFPFFRFYPNVQQVTRGEEKDVSVQILWKVGLFCGKGSCWDSIGKCFLKESYNAYFFLSTEKEKEWRFWKGEYLPVLEIPGSQMNPLHSSHATENNCIKVGGPGLKCSVMLDPKSCPGKCKTACRSKSILKKPG